MEHLEMPRCGDCTHSGVCKYADDLSRIRALANKFNQGADVVGEIKFECDAYVEDE